MSILSHREAISVIIPIYNGVKFISNIVENLKSQTLQITEAIFVNDGSTDGTKESLDELVQKKSPFQCRVIHQENKGVSAARNAGLNAASGKYVCFIDADDSISSDYIELLYNALFHSNLRVAVAHITRHKQDLALCEHYDDVTINSSTEFLRKFLYSGVKYSICACMFEKQCFIENNLFFPEGYRYSEDVYVLWQIFASEKNIAEVNQKIYYYFDNPVSAMNAGIDIRRLDAIALMKNLEPIIQRLNPDFSPEFNKYVVARHHWSILWQAASRLDKYKEFREYCDNFEMKKELKKMLSYPQLKLSLSSLLYVISPFLYYHILRAFVVLVKK